MKKFSVLILAIVCCLLFVFYTTGCGQSGSGETTTTTITITTTTTTTTTLPQGSSITLSGTLTTGLIQSSGAKICSSVSGYNVVAIDNNTGQTYYTSSDATGSFSIDVPASTSYEVSLIDTNMKYFGPIVMVGNSSSSEAVMGIIPTSDTNLGQIVVDTTNNYASPSLEPVSIANFDDLAAATNGVPKGAGNCGKEEISNIITREGSDIDKDGIPNLFDADEDNDGIRNGIATTAMASLVESSTIESVIMNMGMWLSHGSETVEATEDTIHLTLFVTPITGQASKIDNVKCINVPASIKDVAIVWSAGSLGNLDANYPAERSLWSSVDYQMYQTTVSGTTKWVIMVIPKAMPEVGDTFTIRVTYTDGSYEDFFLSFSVMLTNVAKVIEYNDVSVEATIGTQENPITFEADSLQLTLQKPTDEDGDTIAGLSYSISIGSSIEASEASQSLTSSSITETPGDTLSYTVSTITAEVYYIAPIAETADGQQIGGDIWFQKQ